LAPLLSVLLLASCVTTRDLAHDPFPKIQAELRGVFNAMIEDVIAGDVQGLRAGHLNSDKFTKFDGGTFERMNVDECNEGEAAGLTSVQDLELEYKDLKIDVFGNTAIMTCYLYLSGKVGGEPMSDVARNTLVFLDTADGWKIVHEHVTPKACFGQ
jgi:ketosteroid isomerase-like protein